MHQVLILGAGKSSGYLIAYLLSWKGCRVVLADLSEIQLEPYRDKLETILLKADDASQRAALIKNSYLVISMLPAFMHPAVARECLAAGAHLATASYISAELMQMETEVKSAGLWFMNECGLDPGLDHMSAMRMFEQIHASGGHITGFHSYCGGLVAPESMDNPWGYKFSWNPRNVILAGQGTSSYLENGELKFVPYNRLFNQPQTIVFENGSKWDAYPNRDSLLYRKKYGIEDVKTMIRGTLRFEGFCEAWDIFVQMGITDDSYQFPLIKGMTYQEFAAAYLPGSGTDYRARIQQLKAGGFSEAALDKVCWTGLLNPEPIGLEKGSPAMILQHLLTQKWQLRPSDKDLVLMQHIVEYEQDGKPMMMKSSLGITGVDARQTAMAKTVGLPLAVTCKLFMENRFNKRGLLIPTDQEVYDQVLPELEQLGIVFQETTHPA
jgi:saccharopine dehydrogenase (NADP+, L-glutamate forming)